VSVTAMTIGDRIFYSIVSFLFVFFLWVGVLEHYLPLWGCLIVGAIIFYVLIIRYLIRLRKAKLQKKQEFSS
jgi:predicted small integral membrane protein